jgi:D-serine deaminase-like pyridoxal phosphate-dependent protein
LNGRQGAELESRMATDVIGRSKWDLDTPALLVDLDVLERNIATMARYFRAAGVNWRPHTKGQKVPALAHKELDAGAIGITCAKLAEAEVMAAAGIKNILIANQVVGVTKIPRLIGLLGQADVIVAVDSVENAEALSAGAAARARTLGVLVELDLGAHRAGVDPGEPALLLARKVSELPGLRYRGLMGWESHCCPIPDPAEKKRACEEAVSRLVSTAEQCRKAGLPTDIVSCGGTATFQFTAHVPGVTEIQAGGGVFGDVLYESWGVAHPFALSVLSTVTSRPTPTRVVVDAGRKTMSADLAVPRPIGLAEVASVRLSAEHGKVELREGSHEPRIGDKIEWIVGYGDTTVCLHDEMVGIRKGYVESVWPISGRGKLS